MVLYDVKRLRPESNMKKLMLTDLHTLQGGIREDSWDMRMRDSQPRSEIHPVVFGLYVTLSLFGKAPQYPTLDIVYDLEGKAAKIPRRWRSLAFTSHVEIPALLNLHGAYEVAEQFDIVDGRRKVLHPSHVVRLFTTKHPLSIKQLVAIQELTPAQIALTQDRLVRSRNFRLDVEVGRVGVAHADKLKGATRKAAEERATALAQLLGADWTTFAEMPATTA